MTTESSQACTVSAWRIVVPMLVLFGLLGGLVSGYILPAYREAALAERRALAVNLARAACSVLADCEKLEQSGHYSREQAQERAREFVGSMRFGETGNQHFWVVDAEGTLMVHPKQPALVATDVRTETDRAGTRIYATLIKRAKNGEVCLENFAPWHGKGSAAPVPQLTCAKGFGPWGWVVGVSVPYEDVALRVAQFQRNAIILSLVGLVISAILATYLVRHAVRSAPSSGSILDADGQEGEVVDGEDVMANGEGEDES